MQISIPVTTPPALFNRGQSDVNMASFYARCKDLVEARFEKAPNLRGANCTQRQTVMLINSLEEAPGDFAYKCDAITITAQDLSCQTDGQNCIVMLTFPDKKSEIFGLINGGHRLTAMECLQGLGSLSDDAYVQVQVIYGNLKPGFVNSLVITRNDTMRTDKNDVFNKEGKFDILKEIFTGQPFADKIAYCSGFEGRYINPQILAGLVAAFSRHCITYHPILGEVQESRYIGGKLSHDGLGVNAVIKYADEIRKNAKFYNEVMAFAKAVDDAVNVFARKYPNPRLDLTKNRPSLIYINEDDAEIIPRVNICKVLPLICALNQLTLYDVKTQTYRFCDNARSFMSNEYIHEYIKKFVTSREIFTGKNFRKDTQKYAAYLMRDDSKYQQEAARIIREDYRAFCVQRAAEEKLALKAS